MSDRRRRRGFGRSEASRSAIDTEDLGLDVLAALVRASTDGIMVLDADHRFVYANQATCELFGRPLHRLLGRGYFMFVPKWDRQASLTLLAGIGAGESARASALVSQPDGSEREMELTAIRLDLGGQQLLAMIVRDVRDPHRQAREATALASVRASDSVDATVQAIAECAVIGTHALAAWVTFGDEGCLGAWVGAVGTPDGFRECVRATASMGPSSAALMQVLTTQRVVVYADARRQVEGDPRASRVAAALRSLPWQAGVFAPLVYRGELVGVLTAVYAKGELPTEAETTFLTALADQAALAAASARLVSTACEEVTARLRNSNDEEAIREALDDLDACLQELRRFEGARQTAGRSIGNGIDLSTREAAVDHLLQLSRRRPIGLIAPTTLRRNRVGRGVTPHPAPSPHHRTSGPRAYGGSQANRI